MKVIAEKKANGIATQIVSDGAKYFLAYRHDVPFNHRDRMIQITAEQVDSLIAERGLIPV